MAILSRERGVLLFSSFVTFGLLASEPVSASSLENLDELIARKSRISTAPWSRAILEGAAPSSFWQSETVSYQDITTGAEVWKLTNTPGRTNFTQDISSAHWSADGKRLAFGSNRPNAARPTATTADQTWMLALTDGSRLRPGADLSNYNYNWCIYPAWNPAKADTLYLPGNGTSGKNYFTLYANTISDAAVTTSPVVSIDGSVTRRLFLMKSVSSDGRKIYFSDYTPNLGFVADLTTQTLESPSTGYSQNFGWDTYWGDLVTPTAAWHGRHVTGAVNGNYGIWNYHMPSGSSVIWRARLSSSMPSHAPDHFPPYDWGGSLEPVNTVSQTGKLDPWNKVDYPSHFTPDRWGHYGLFSDSSGVRTGGKYGSALMDLETHDYWNSAYVFSGANVPWVQHHDWSAWSDWSISSGSPQMAEDYRLFRLTKQNFRNPASQQVIAMTHNFENSGGKYSTTPNYYAYTRPSQSPDGTKVMFNSTFLEPDDKSVQLYWAVAYYPYPPEVRSASKSSGTVHLVWDFNQGSSCATSSASATRTGPTPNFTNARTYSTRGWPDEVLDCPPSPRELKQFRVWSSADGATWAPQGLVGYNNCSGTNECGMWTEKSWSFDAAQSSGTTRYYAVTSLEQSGLESRTLSNIWKVTLDGAGNVLLSGQTAAYPANPGGKTRFYTVNPAAPEKVAFAHQLAPATSAGQYTITWSEPATSALIRYYNIYAADGAAPSTTQQRRIASMPASADYSGTGSFKYIDWLGNPDGSTNYLVTSVDFQGNESSLRAPKSPTGLRVQ